MIDFCRSQFTRIKGLSDRRRFPRLGKIRLGLKTVSQGGKEYPREVDYFVCPEEVRKIHGLRPKELEVLFPLNDIEIIFPQRYELYGSARGLKCVGNGEAGSRVNEKTGARQEVKCPCDLLGRGCNKRGHLFFILPRVTFGGVYQVDVGSYHSIVNINSGLDYVKALFGRFAGIRLKLKREPQETHRKGSREIHYPVKVFFDGNIDSLRALRSGDGLLIPEYIPGSEIRSGPIAGDDIGDSGLPSPEEELRVFEEKEMVGGRYGR